MTTICGGGTSGPQTGASAVVLVGSGVIATMLEQSGNPWLEFAAALLSLPDLVLSTFCATDPPAMPTLTAAESNALLQLTFGPDLTSGLAKFKDIVLNLSWQQYCHCTSGALVVPPPLTPPAGTSIYQPPSPQQVQACYHQIGPQRTMANGNTYAFTLGLAFVAPNIPTSYRLTSTATLGLGSGSTYKWDVFSTVGAVDTPLAGSVAFPAVGTAIQSGPITDPNATGIGTVITSTGSGAGNTSLVNSVLDLYCSGQMPGTQPTGCCLPDVATQSTLDLILRMTTLIQRQIVPFAYISGTAHTGITGNGTIAVSNVLGLKVAFTTKPSRLGADSGDPINLWGAGWINAGTADGFGPRIWVTSDPMIIKPLSADITVIGYSIPTDCVLTITELLREP